MLTMGELQANCQQTQPATHVPTMPAVFAIQCSCVPFKSMHSHDVLTPICCYGVCRLPKLSSISLTVEPATPRQPARQRPGVNTLLRTMRKSLSGLRYLNLMCKQNWQGASKVWQELGLFTQLTALDLEFADEVSHVARHAV
jgi:hypothetical protein